jgi:hypothetical protein
MPAVRPFDRQMAEGRLREAVQFWEAAGIVLELADDESDGTKAGCSFRAVSADDRRRAQRQAERLVNAARERFPGG